MSTFKDSKLAKAVAGIVGVASGVFMLGLVAVPSANAQTTAELQAQIQSLLQQIATLQSQLDGGGASAHAGCSVDFTQNFSTGSKGNQVMQLQQFLNAESGIQVAASGPGSPGNETSYYGPLTAQAVTAFQNKYSADVLAPVGLTSGTGYWGPSSRSKANAICAASAADDGTDDGDDTDDSDDETLSGGEGQISSYTVLGDPSDEDLSESDTEQVFGFEFEADGSDLSVRRVDVLFEANGSPVNNEDPWDFVDTVSLYHGDDKVAELDASDEDDWSDEGDDSTRGGTNANEFKLRFSGISEKVSEGDTDQFYIEVEAKDNLDSGDLDQEFLVSIGDGSTSDDGIRAVDGAGINQYTGDASDTISHTYTGADNGTLSASVSDNTPAERAVQVDSSNDTDGVELLVFELSADNQDIEVTELVASTSVSDDDINDVFKSLTLYRDGSKVKTVSFGSGATSSSDLTFGSLSEDIEEDDDVEFSIEGDLKDTSNYSTSTFAYVTVDSADIVAEETSGNKDDLASGDLSGSVSGNKIHLYEVAPTFSLVSTTVNNPSTDDDGNGADTKATFKITFDVTADDDSAIHIPFYDANGGNSIVASTTDGTGTVLSPEASTSITITHDSGATKKTNTWKISSGNTAQFTVTIAANNDDAKDGRFTDRFVAGKVESLQWGTDDTVGDADDTDFDFNLDDWETDPESLDN